VTSKKTQMHSHKILEHTYNTRILELKEYIIYNFGLPNLVKYNIYTSKYVIWMKFKY
jgi:hypothetical protein